MRKVLIPIHTNTYLSGMLPLALSLRNTGRFEPKILFVRHYPTLYDDVLACKKVSITVYLGNGMNGLSESVIDRGPTAVTATIGRLGKLKKYISLLRSPRFFFHLIFSHFFSGSIAWGIFELLFQIRFVRNFIRINEISLLILPSDNRYDLPAYVRAAHHEHIGVVLVPQFMAGPLEWAEYVWDQPAYHGKRFLNRLTRSLFPRWGIHYKGRNLVALPGAQIIARELLGIAPRLPWVLHSGHADLIALESEAVREYCITEGLAPDNLVVTGSSSHDVMFDLISKKSQKKVQLLRSLGIANDLPILLSALPPDSLYMNRPECDFQSYSQLIEFWCKSVSLVQGYHHLVVLHPSLKYDEMKYIEGFGLKIVREPTANIVPLCDIYVASISSTIQWAIACGKPVLNYDVYRYRYTDYQNMEGVITVEEQQDFLRVLKRLTSDPAFYERTASSQASVAAKWGRLDGKAGERLEALLTSIIEIYQGAGKP